ncbi:MAG: hypothetical protein NTX25_09740 [Proteobacteria bacterium]|nr:hypothetical protein [Pseudomonadota bacterium]
MRLILWILSLVGLVFISHKLYELQVESRFIAHPAYMKEQEVYLKNPQSDSYAAIPSQPISPDQNSGQEQMECAFLQNIDWESILSHHTWMNGTQRRESIEANTVWTLRLKLLAFLGMEYDVFEIERLTAQNISYRRLEYGQGIHFKPQIETHAFQYFQEKTCGLNRVHPLLYVASDLGQIALSVAPEFVNRFMNQADFRVQLGQRLNKQFHMDVNQARWTLEDLMQLAEQH